MLTLLCLVDAYLTPLYCMLSATAISSQAVPFLKDLAAHGKTRRQTAQHHDTPAASFLQNWVVPKCYFSHFYILGIGVTVYLTTHVMKRQTNTERPTTMFRLSSMFLLLVHLVRRYYECRCVHAWRSDSHMHIAGYLLGMLHYLLLPLVFVDGLCRWDNKGDSASAAHYRETGLRLGLGVTLCLWGQYQQFRHHMILAKLRSGAHRRNGGAYTIPYGGWFRYTSCPHYLAEVVIYLGFAVLLFDPRHPHTVFDRSGAEAPRSGMSLYRYRSLALLAWVTTNLSVSALHSHRWYLQAFPKEYPPLRRDAIFPNVL